MGCGGASGQLGRSTGERATNSLRPENFSFFILVSLILNYPDAIITTTAMKDPWILVGFFCSV
jgi:hypothetical protein